MSISSQVFELDPEGAQRLKAVHKDLLEPVWPDGRNPAVSDGIHYVAKGYQRPVSVSRLEAFVLAQIACMTTPSRIIEVGTGFGYSSAWLALGARCANPEARIATIDDLSEGELGPEGQRLAKIIHVRLGISDNVQCLVGATQDVVPRHLSDWKVDLAFIDGNHHGEAPQIDYRVLSSRMQPNGILAFHDVDPSRYKVHEAIAIAEAEGWISVPLGTSCFLTVLGRSASVAMLAEHAILAAKAAAGRFDEF